MKKSRDFKYIGQRPLRPDGIEKVTGKALYGADINLPGTIHGKILRSPHAHARILSINTDKAKSLPGVHAVITSKDLIKKYVWEKLVYTLKILKI